MSRARISEQCIYFFFNKISIKKPQQLAAITQKLAGTKLEVLF